MGPDLEKAINELSLRMRMMRAVQEAETPLSERESLVLQLIGEQGRMAVTQVAAAWPNVSESTISMTLTKLWRGGLVSKTTHPENQRITLVELTAEGHAQLESLCRARIQRMKILFDSIQLTPEEKQVIIDVCQRGVRYMDQFLDIKSMAEVE